MIALPSLFLAVITWQVILLAIAFVAICLFMMLVILIQKPKGGGLSGAFGGAGGGETSFVGAKVGDFLTWLTVSCFVLFILLAMGLTWAINPHENAARDRESLTAEQAAEAAAEAALGSGSGVDPNLEVNLSGEGDMLQNAVEPNAVETAPPADPLVNPTESDAAMDLTNPAEPVAPAAPAEPTAAPEGPAAPAAE